MKPKKDHHFRTCDVCDGLGWETPEDLPGAVAECHLCEGSGYFDENGDPVPTDEDE